MLGHASDCASCAKLRRLTLRRLALDVERFLAVQTWCRICGMPLFLEMENSYEDAKRKLMALDDQPMACKNLHAETGGWGVHWRFDEILVAMFPRQHKEERWSKPVWYEHSNAETQPVQVLTKDQLSVMAPRLLDLERKMIQEMINRNPRTRDELLQVCDDVYDHQQLEKEFEVQGCRAPFVVAIKRTTGEKGSLMFQHHPRFYFAWDPSRVI